MSDNEVRERLVVVETQLTELPKVRERIHELVQCTQQLVSAEEDAADSRKEVLRKIEGLIEKVDNGTLTTVRAEVQLGATMAAHIEHCKTDKAEQKELITRLGIDRERMHAENQTRFQKIERLLYIAIGIAIAFEFAGKAIGELLTKAIK